MKIAITSEGPHLDSPACPNFGRCPVFLIVDTETMQFDVLPNQAIDSPSGAGIQAAELVVERGAEWVVSGHVGPKAKNVLDVANIRVTHFENGSVRAALNVFLESPAIEGEKTGDQELEVLQNRATEIRERIVTVRSRLIELEKENSG
jgi:predicted Fe-Mo cluster-binding NifX family protein